MELRSDPSAAHGHKINGDDDSYARLKNTANYWVSLSADLRAHSWEIIQKEEENKDKL